MCDRALTGPTAEELAKHFTVLNYDRRDSGDTGPYAVEREIEDIGALIGEAGGTASVYGHSSGAGLALHATAYGVPIDKLVLHEPPYNTDGEEEQRISREYALDLEALLSEGSRGDAVEGEQDDRMPGRAIDGGEIVSHMRLFGLFLHTLEGIRARRGAEAHSLGPQSGVTFALDRPTSPFAQASRLALLAVIGLETIARAALVPEDVGLVSEDLVTGEGVIGGRRPFEAADYHHTAREAGGS
jgi:hypothetical protein